MYLLYNKIGNLIAKILNGDEPIRQNSTFNIYICFELDNPLITDNNAMWIKLKEPNEYNWNKSIDELVPRIDNIVFHKSDDVENTMGFVENREYICYKYSSGNKFFNSFGNAEMSISLYKMQGDEIESIKALGNCIFNVERTSTNNNSYINPTQYNYLLGKIGTIPTKLSQLEKDISITEISDFTKQVNDLIDTYITNNFDNGNKGKY